MNAIFINSENSKTSDHHRLLCNLSDKIDLKRSDWYVALSNRNKKKCNKSNKLEISAPTLNEKFKLLDTSFCVSDIQDYFEYIKKHQTVTDNPPISIYVNKTENRILSKLKKGITNFWLLKQWNCSEALKIR